MTGDKFNLSISAETTIAKAKKELALELGVKSENLKFVIYGKKTSDDSKTFAQVLKNKGMHFSQLGNVHVIVKGVSSLLKKKRLDEIDRNIAKYKAQIQEIEKKIENLKAKKKEFSQ